MKRIHVKEYKLDALERYRRGVTEYLLASTRYSRWFVRREMRIAWDQMG